MFRSQLGNIFMMQTSDLKGLKLFPVPEDVQKILVKENRYLKKYEGILYDVYTNELEKKKSKNSNSGSFSRNKSTDIIDNNDDGNNTDSP
jgi:hypothetical protein